MPKVFQIAPRPRRRVPDEHLRTPLHLFPESMHCGRQHGAAGMRSLKAILCSREQQCAVRSDGPVPTVLVEVLESPHSSEPSTHSSARVRTR